MAPKVRSKTPHPMQRGKDIRSWGPPKGLAQAARHAVRLIQQDHRELARPKARFV